MPGLGLRPPGKGRQDSPGTSQAEPVGDAAGLFRLSAPIPAGPEAKRFSGGTCESEAGPPQGEQVPNPLRPARKPYAARAVSAERSVWG